MKLTHPELERQITLEKQTIWEWIIESPMLFAKYVQELITQAEGEEGTFVLSEGERELKLSSNAEIILDPFSVDLNSRKILKKLYTELSEIATREELYLHTQELLGRLQEYFLQLEQISGYMLECAPELNIAELLGAMDVQFECYAEDFFERIAQYIKIIAEVLGIRLIVFVNLRSYLDDRQLRQLLELASYSEIAVLLIENVQRDFADDRQYYIIDKDNCEVL